MSGAHAPSALSSYATSVVKLNGTNYSEWKEQVEFSLGVLELDMALLKDQPSPLTDSSTPEERKFHVDWERSNRLSMMFMRMVIDTNIKSSLPTAENAKEYLKNIEERFKTADKSLAGKLMTDLVTMKFDDIGNSSVNTYENTEENTMNDQLNDEATTTTSAAKQHFTSHFYSTSTSLPPSMPTASFFSLAAALLLCAATILAVDNHNATEIDSLINFKTNLHDPRGALDGWDASTPLAPCDWRGVYCFNDRVYELRLPRLQLAGPLSDQLANLRQLRRLSLHNNAFNSSIPLSLSTLSLLRAVYLQNNEFSGEIPPEISNITNLEVLNLANNQLSGRISGDLPVQLRYLDLTSNRLSGDIPYNFTAFHNLQLINLSFNQFSGEIPASIGYLTQLQYLYLDSNKLYGTIPSAISNCSMLVHFSAGDNLLRGLVPASIGALSKLQVVSLSSNQLSGMVPVSFLCNVSVNSSSIRILQLGFNEFTGISEPLNVLCFSGLQVLELHENSIDDVFPSWLTNFSTLRILDISGNLFSGDLVDGIGKLSRLEEFRVANNLFSGEIPSSIRQCRLLRVLDLEGNGFSGSIPEFFGELQGLKILSLGRNRFSGSIPPSLGQLNELELLNLSENNLTGKLPEEVMQLSNLTTLNLSNNEFLGEVLIGSGGLEGLQVLNLSGCGFSGKVPASIGGLLNLKTLDLSKQKLSGKLPIELFGLPSLQVVALEENLLSGDVPEGFSSLSSLQFLNLSSNEFTGKIPAEYGFLHSLLVLSLSNNHISGLIPVELGNSSTLEVLELRGNSLTGNIPDDISDLSHLRDLDLGRNRLTGVIPENISNCLSLSSLCLDGNLISGQIPDSLSRLLNLTELNLSSNNLTGDIPADLLRIPSLKYLNLSSNNLEGEIPWRLASQFNDPSVFEKNRRLCGKPLHKECKNERRKKRKRLILLILVIAIGAAILACCCCGYIIGLVRWRKKLRAGLTGEKKKSPARGSSGTEGGRGSGDNGGPKLIMFNTKLTYAETLEATRHFDEENVLSRGKYGLVYKATFLDGMVLAIRRLPDASVNEGTFRKEAESLGKVKHRNLTVLRGYYIGAPNTRLLVYDYMPNGNLSTLLQEASHQDGHVLNWPMRHLIALGIARGLAFLHSTSMVHGDIKPQNVLFDADFEAHLCDYGLEKLALAPNAEASTSSTPMGTLGYVSPEATLSGQASKEADVYSFGIVLLEILTGRKAVMFTEDEDIVKWVKKQLQRGQISELLEPGLLELDPESSEWEEFMLGLKVGLLCTTTDPLERPSMTDVVFMLEGCRIGPDIPSPADPTSTSPL
ncbi:putative LRR receptor-like serine/threonine-protein kinase [Heracleum sosnowskyi]|uniref:LRR receptor-like serine/threonine-protein kinase n=1 Tax=Heracleum sosnowskyi TaxID=360622 RepID=A0AAD8IUY7_9APIA|nr:putative LRR receptor-like serine/threonine-protein kinase [Heracleum sosnowskyi]